MSPFTKEYMILLVLLIAAAMLMNLVPDASSIWLDVPMKSVIFLLLVIPLAFKFRISPEFNEMILKGLSSIGWNKNL